MKAKARLVLMLTVAGFGCGCWPQQGPTRNAPPDQIAIVECAFAHLNCDQVQGQ